MVKGAVPVSSAAIPEMMVLGTFLMVTSFFSTKIILATTVTFISVPSSSPIFLVTLALLTTVPDCLELLYLLRMLSLAIVTPVL